MTARILSKTSEEIEIVIKVKHSRSMMESEQNILESLSQAGCLATVSALESFDTDGSAIVKGSVKFTSKGQVPKEYLSPYGKITVNRHVYQTSKGGAIYCPLEDSARIILTSTPRFAEMVSRNMSEMSAEGVVRDLKVSHNVTVVRNVVQRLALNVAEGISLREETWEYSPPKIDDEVKVCVYGMDGASLLMTSGEWRQAMAGTISLYGEKEVQRLHTTYCAAAPEYGKASFKERMSKEIKRNQELYPNAIRVGIADGAADNWEFLEQYTDRQTLDFYHASEYIAEVGEALFADEEFRKKWVNNRCHQMKHVEAGAAEVLKEVLELTNHSLKGTSPSHIKFKTRTEDPLNPDKPPKWVKETVEVKGILRKNLEMPKINKFQSYFQNNLKKNRMTYAENLKEGIPIGSGPTEAACKMLIKSRLCQSGMRWKEEGAGMILTIRSYVKTAEKWDQFWKKVDQFGFPPL